MGFLAYRPVAYRVDQDEIVRCPTDGKMNDVDASYCDQDGTMLAGRLDIPGFTGTAYVPRPYAPQPDETICCPTDQARNDDDAVFCDQDGTKLLGRMDVTGHFVMQSKTCPPNRPWASIDVQTNALRQCYATEEDAEADTAAPQFGPAASPPAPTPPYVGTGAPPFGLAAVTGEQPMPPK